MAVNYFPPVSRADDHGLLAVGGDLEVATLLNAYRHGIFPWPFPDGELAWFSPPERGIIRLPLLKVSRTLRKLINKNEYRFSFNSAFNSVVDACRSEHRAQGEWLFEPLCEAYKALHRIGHAYSSEVWRADQLVGGVFGVTIGTYYSGESMFHREDNTSKLALLNLLQDLAVKNVSFLDCQVVTPTSALFGAELIDRKEYLMLLKTALATKSLQSRS